MLLCKHIVLYSSAYSSHKVVDITVPVNKYVLRDLITAYTFCIPSSTKVFYDYHISYMLLCKYIVLYD